MQSNKQHKIIIDTDPGIDDAIAILLALNHPDIDLLGLTTVFGNLPTEGATKNALDLLQLFGHSDVPVAKGMSLPLQKPESGYAHFVHGDNGLGNVEIPSSNKSPSPLSGPEFIVEQVLKYPNEVTICAIAPLTNLAKALELEPKIADLVKQVVIMGGTVKEAGNVSPVAEANVNNDPHAADIVLTANWPVTLVGLDVTLKVMLDEEFMLSVKNSGASGSKLYDISRFYDDFYRTNGHYDGFACHDATAVVYITNPDIFNCIQGPIRVGHDGLCEGMTIIDTKMNYMTTNPWSEKPKVNVCMDVDCDKVKNILLQYLK